MCTAVTFTTNHHYFGRNMDFDLPYQQSVTVSPRNYPFQFRFKSVMQTHFAMIGMAKVEDGYPLYYDATNEHGLSMAGLYFPDHAVYNPFAEDMDNITPYEFIPWILGQCATIEQVRAKLERLNLVNVQFSKKYPLSPLHWIIADRSQAITVEPTAQGIIIYDNDFGVLTNNPPFDYHMYNLCNYLNLTADEPVNRFACNCTLKAYSRGMGAIGLPGDFSSSSRFIRAAFVKLNSVCDSAESSSVSQFFHILSSVAQQKGCVKVGDGYEKTIYSSCCNTDTGVYYYTSYDNSQITGICMHNTDLDGQTLRVYNMITQQQIRMES